MHALQARLGGVDFSANKLFGVPGPFQESVLKLSCLMSNEPRAAAHAEKRFTGQRSVKLEELKLDAALGPTQLDESRGIGVLCRP